MENAKYVHRGFWIKAENGKYYMISYNFSPLSKRKQILEISREEYEKYEKHVVDF